MRGALLTVLSAGALLQCLHSATLPPNPCPNLFQYQQDTNGDVYGRVVLENDYSGYYNLLVNMSIAVFPLGEYIMAEMKSTDDDIRAGRPLVYDIFFPIQEVIPRLTSIEFNKVHCYGPPEELGPSGVTKMWISRYYTISLPFKRPPVNLERKWQPERQPPTQYSSPFSWESRQQPLITSSTHAPLSWQEYLADRTTSESLCSSPWQQSFTDLEASKSLSLSPCQPPFTASGTSKPLPWKHLQRPLKTSKTPSWLLVRYPTPTTTSASLSPSPWQISVTASTTNAPLPKRTLWPSSTASTTSVPFFFNTLQQPLTTPTTLAPMPSEPSTHSPKSLQSLDWLSLAPSVAPAPSTEYFSLSGEECGLSVVNTQDLVDNKEDFMDGQFPWLVAIRYFKGADLHYRCTGSLVSDRHVITAGHCVRNNAEVEDYRLTFGNKSVSSWERAYQRELQNISVHPDYTAKKDADIAILTVKERIEFKANIKPVCLWDGEEYMNRMGGMQGTVVGWWFDRTRREIAAKKIVLPIVSQTECNTSSSISSVVTSRTFCAGLKGADPCHGDSGAGFAIQKDGRWILRGVASTAVGDLDSCDKVIDNYFVFVDIDKVMSWIKEVIT